MTISILQLFKKKKTVVKKIDVNDNVIHNSSHVLVNFPFVILFKILTYLDTTIDRVCFSLVCKRWMSERDRYFSFNGDNMMIRYINEYKHTQLFSLLKGFRPYIEGAVKTKYNLVLIYNTLPPFEEHFDYHCTNMEEAKRLISKFNFKTCLIGRCPQLELFMENLKVQDIKTLRFLEYHPIREGLIPDNIETLLLDDIEIPITNFNFLPRHLSKLFLGNNFTQVINANMFPKTLEILELGDDFRSEIHSLPPNLTTLQLSIYYELPIENAILPSTLHTFINAFIINNLHENQTLKRLVCSSPDIFDDPNFQRFPSSLTRLEFVVPEDLSKVKYECISPSVNDLALRYRNNPNEKSHVIDIHRLLINPDSKHIKTLRISAPFYSSLYMKPGCIPEGVTKLKCDFLIANELTKDLIPSTVIDYKMPVPGINMLNANSIPDSVERLNLNYYQHAFPKNVIPPSVRHIVLPVTFFLSHSIEKTIPMTVNSIVLLSSQGKLKFLYRRLDAKYMLAFTLIEEYVEFSEVGIKPIKEIDAYFKRNPVI